jgi:hypothetical protein
MICNFFGWNMQEVLEENIRNSAKDTQRIYA